MARPEITNLHGLRSLAILPVLALHASYGFLQGGFLGVDLFFVLSGFLITWILYGELRDSATVNFRNFYIRRARRLLPAAFASIALAIVLWPLTKTEDTDLVLAVTSVLFYFANLVDSKTLGSLSAAWSLSIEEQFYLVWPITLLGLYKLFSGRRRPIIICLCVAVLFVAVVQATLFHFSAFTFDLYRGTLFRVDALLAGAIAAIAFASSATLNKKLCNAIVVFFPLLFCLGVWFVPWWHPALYYGGFTLIAIFAAILVFALTQVSPNWLFSHPIMTWIGKRSYGMYVYHMPIFHALNHVHIVEGRLNFIIVTFLRFALTFIVADLSYRYFEKRFLIRKSPPIRLTPAFNVPPDLEASKTPPA